MGLFILSLHPTTMTNTNHRKQITLDGETEDIADTHVQNLSAYIREKLREDFRAISTMQEKLEELESKKKQKRKQIHELEEDIDELDTQINRIDRAIAKNEAVQKIRSDPELERFMESAVADIREVKGKEKVPAATDMNGNIVEWEPAPEPEVVLQEKLTLVVQKCEDKGITVKERKLRETMKIASGLELEDTSF